MYEVTLTHAGTRLQSPDYDYTLACTPPDDVTLDDLDELFRSDEYGGSNFTAAGKVATLTVDPPAPSSSGTLGASVVIDRDTILFEDAYTNAPGEVVARQSTWVQICVSFTTGASAASGTFSVSQGGERIRLHSAKRSGTVVGAPQAVDLPAQSACRMVFYAEGIKASSALNDVKLLAEITSGGSLASDIKTVTVGQVKVETKVDFPQGFRTRHIYGVAELVECAIQPYLLNVVWNCSYTNQQTVTATSWEYEMPSSPRFVTFKVNCSGACLPITMRAVAPSGYYVPREPYGIIFPKVQIGDSGGFGMLLDLGVMPTNVCFSRVRVIEGVSSDDVHSGYYANKTNDWHHGIAEGAWKIWSEVSDSNLAGQDEVIAGTNAPPWQKGVLCWRIPNYWRTVTDPTTNYFCTTPQIFRMYTNGTQALTKFNWMVFRQTNTNTRIWIKEIKSRR